VLRHVSDHRRSIIREPCTVLGSLMMDPLWSETCWSTFKYFIILIVSTYYVLCISWIIKCLIMYSFCYIFWLLYYILLLLCYVLLLLCMFCSVYSVSLCCSVYCLCVCHLVSTQLQLTNISYHIYHTQKLAVQLESTGF